MSEFVYRHRMPRKLAEDYSATRLGSLSTKELAAIMSMITVRQYMVGDRDDELNYYSIEKPKTKKAKDTGT